MIVVRLCYIDDDGDKVIWLCSGRIVDTIKSLMKFHEIVWIEATHHEN